MATQLKCPKLIWLIFAFSVFLQLFSSSSASALPFSGLSLKSTGQSYSSIGGTVRASNTSQTDLTIDSNRHVRYTTQNSAVSMMVNINEIDFPSAISVSADNYYSFIIGFQSYYQTGPILWNITSTDSGQSL